MRKPLVLAVAAMIAATACSAPEAAAAPPVTWEACGAGFGSEFDCATVQVPVDHAEPDGPRIGLGLVRHKATDPARRLGSMLVNPGGPGAPASTMVRLVGQPGDPYGPEITARYDIVGMDPRGVGDSEQVRCLTDQQRETALAVDRDPSVVGLRPLADIRADAREFAAGCASGVEPELLGQLSTDVVARDMDAVRAALGEERISYLGQSYGTLLGATFATLFPRSVDRMVLDAPIDPVTWRQDPLGATVEQTVSAEAVLEAYFARCVAEGSACTFGDGRPAEAFDALVARLEAQPLTTKPVGTVPAGRVDGAALLDAARLAVFQPSLWPLLTRALTAARAGDGLLVLLLGQSLVRNPDGTPNGLAESNLAVNCLDRVHPALIEPYEANAAELAAVAPRFGTQAGYIFLPCAGWPAANPDRYLDRLDGAGAPPILVIGGRLDSQTPYPWAEKLTGTLESGVLLTREGPGHGSWGTGNPCINSAVDAYLRDGALPATGAACAALPTTTVAPATT